MKFENHNALPISESVRNNWAKEAEKYFEKNPEQKMYYIRSGDSVIFATNYDNNLTIMDCNIRRISHSYNL